LRWEGQKEYHGGVSRDVAGRGPLELVFADSKDMLASYVADGPGQLRAPLPGPPAPGTMPVGKLVPITLAFRDRPLRILVQCRVIAVTSDGDGHWVAQLEFMIGGEARQTLNESARARRAPRGPVRVRVTLPDGRKLDAVARGIDRETIDLDVTLPAEVVDMVKLSIRPPGKILPIRLLGEPRAGGTAGTRIGVVFREPREELLWSQLAEDASAHPSRLLLA
jgi:hypothetical protein